MPAPIPDPGKDLVVHWPRATPAVPPLLKQLGARALLTDPDPLAAGLVEACDAAGVALIADLPAAADLNPLRAALESARSAGFTAAALRPAGDASAFGKLLADSGGFAAIVFLTAEQIDQDVRPAQAVLRHGVWPGIAAGDTGAAGATESVWLDANSSLVAHLRALYPWRSAVLGYRPDKDGGVPETRSVPARSAEVALADAFSAGGHVVLSLHGDYRNGLLKGEQRALDAWKSLAEAHEFMRGARALADAPLAGRTAVLCGGIEETGEILNLAFRKNLCPVAISAAAPPPLSTANFDVVVAANIELKPAVVENAARFAASGGAVLAAPAGEEKSPWWTTRGWKRIHSEEDRDLYAAGKGLVYGYHSLILDPGAFALDLKDAIARQSQPQGGLKNLDLRIWAADTVLGVLHRVSPSSVAVVLTAYGNLPRRDFLISVRGRYRRAAIREVGSPGARPVRLMPRAGRVEINLTQMSRVAIVTLEE
ncbi:MAG: hypothetical protein HXY18_15090 [Bryobacteraceae bacterium]|nr:hypothetical protein [Bryobacteraceae bacterium]